MAISPQTERHAENAAATLFAISLQGKKALMLLISALIVYATAFQGSRGIYEPDEGRYSHVALQMLKSGDWLIPRFNVDTEHFTKPPLTYWITAAAMWLLGRNEWAIRLPLAAAFIATVLLMYSMGKRIAPAGPWVPALCYATFPITFGAANVLTTDTFLTLFEALAATGYVYAITETQPSRRPRFFLLMWLGFGLAFLTKGPPGILFLLAFLLGGFLLRRPRFLREFFHPLGLLLFCILGFGWFAVVLYQRPELLNYFLMDEVVGRVVTAQHDRNAQWYKAFVIYIPGLVFGSFPWTFAAGRLLPAWARRLHPKYFRRHSSHRSLTTLLLLWVLLPLVIFMLAKSRLILYILPLFIPLSLLLGRSLQYRPLFPSQRTRYLFLGWVALLLCAKGVYGLVPNTNDDRFILRHFEESLHEVPATLLFVDNVPSWGMSIYLDCDIYWTWAIEPDPGKAHYGRLPLSALLCRLKRPMLIICNEKKLRPVKEELERLALQPDQDKIFGKDLHLMLFHQECKEQGGMSKENQ
jgi:4-amino-4-deoxy-L-arabinose transferase-like glycosyltransferase